MPFRSLFLCGGVRQTGNGRASSLRDYLYRTRGIRFSANIVFAEDANQIYRDTRYSDLISFEEDIARIVSCVLVIVESPGSFAELGAFAMNDTISQSLRVIVQTKFADSESFIRYGPIQKLRNDNPDSVAFYPWETSKAGSIVASSVKPHYKEIKSFISNSIESATKNRLLESDYEIKKFMVIYWVLYHSHACSLTVLHWAVVKILPLMTMSGLKNCLYCLRLVGWIDRESYSNKEYYFALSSVDPISYSIPRSKPHRDMLSRSIVVRKEFAKKEVIPSYILGIVKSKRGALK